VAPTLHGNPLVLSASSVGTFLRCGQQWYYAYVLGIKSPPSVKQTLGIAAHRAVEYNMRQKLDTFADIPLTDFKDSFSSEYDMAVGDVIEPEEDVGKAKDSGIKLMTLHHKYVAPSIQPLWVEQPIQFNINDIPYSGQVDLVATNPREKTLKKMVRDTKTTARRPSGGAYFLNMTGYAIGFREATGEVEDGVVLDYLVRTKVPQYVPIESGGPVDDQSILRFTNVITSVYDAISEGRFVPNGIYNNACSYCGYNTICPYTTSSS
jgi:CRISPR/Cas system-associated exonuclease Cas4 (RecB family)